jgi:hypothetical protein
LHKRAMQKRKKKPSIHSRQKLEEAHRRKEFFHKVHYVCKLFTGNSSVYKLLPERELELLYYIHFPAMRVVACEGYAIDPHLVVILKEVVSKWLKGTTVCFSNDGPEVSLDLLYTVCKTLDAYLQILEDNKFPAAAAFKKAMHKLAGDEEVYKRAMEKMTWILIRVEYGASDYNNLLHWADWVAEDRVRGSGGQERLFLKIKCIKPEIRQMSINGKSRAVMRIGWGYSNSGIQWLAYTQEELGSRFAAGAAPYNVYIQPHAFRRIEERLDSIDPMHHTLNLYLSLKYPVISEGRNNHFLIEYKIDTFKAGYLVAGIYENSVVIHTFLFLTNNSTPEGDKLRNNTGLVKLDKEYLTIDKLSTFWESDIHTNEKVKNIFIEAGCSSLFEPNLKLLRVNGKAIQLSVAERIHNYIFARQEVDYSTYEKEQMPV